MAPAQARHRGPQPNSQLINQAVELLGYRRPTGIQPLQDAEPWALACAEVGFGLESGHAVATLARVRLDLVYFNP